MGHPIQKMMLRFIGELSAWTSMVVLQLVHIVALHGDEAPQKYEHVLKLVMSLLQSSNQVTRMVSK
jgi:hypothetical protein